MKYYLMLKMYDLAVSIISYESLHDLLVAFEYLSKQNDCKVCISNFKLTDDFIFENGVDY